MAPKGYPEEGSYVVGNCTWYAWGRASEMLGSPIELSASDPIGLLEEARASGVYEAGSTPQVGALCIGYSGYGSAHVSIIENITDEGVYVSESGYDTALSWPGFAGINFHYGFSRSWMSGGVLGYVYILGRDGSAAGATPEEVEEPSDQWERIWGEGAYDTMSAVLRSDGAFEDDRGGTVLVATGDGYWDALAASGLAGVLDAPVVITPSDELCWQAASELERLDPDRVFVLGGELAVTDSVMREIRTICPNAERIFGDAADDTAVAIHESGQHQDGWGSTAVIATCEGYWDALSIGPYAFAAKAPIFLTNGATGLLSDATLDAIAEGGFERVIVVGGRLVVPYEVEDQLRDLGIDEVRRLWGETALDTSAEIAAWAIDEEGMGISHLAVATTNGYWDALAAAPVAGQTGSVLVLVGPDGGYQAFERANIPGRVRHGHVLGGRIALSVSVWNTIVSAS